MKLTRFAFFKDRTIGRLEHDGKAWWSIERPWKANAPSISCIPEGDYLLQRYDSTKFGSRTWQVIGAPGRTYIAIHAANYAHQLEGCIALGAGLFADLGGVTSSGIAIDEFYQLTAEDDELLIRIVRGEGWFE